MIYTEFKEWLEKNTIGYETFIIKAANYQIEKNKNRPQKNAGMIRK
ncbi:hypothetical protein [Enterococcus faecium]|nr:hypothetical protein [Enterococcus faecium]